MEPFIYFAGKNLFIVSIIVAMYYFLVQKAERVKLIQIAVFSLPLTYILGVIARSLYYNPRPFVVEGFEPLIPHIADNGFPSDHVLLVATIATVFTVFSIRVASLLWLITVLVAVARVYVGVHHFIDILASILISILSVGVVYFIDKNRRNAT